MTMIGAPPAQRWMGRLAPVALVIAIALAFANSLDGPLVFDDLPAIRDNSSLSSLRTALVPPSADGNTVGGRPLLNLSFALNHELGGLDVRGYHLANLLIHAAGAILLWLVLRRLFVRRDVAHGPLLAFAIALLWTVHPLTTAAVTYTVQRAESLAACWSLLAIHAFLRGADGRRSWLVISVAATLAGVATKETAAVVPVVILLLDRTCVMGAFRPALRARAGYYASLAASWLVLALLVNSAGARGGSIGETGAYTSLGYLATQCHAIAGYLRLTFWPTNLVFDHGSPLIPWRDAWPYATGLAAAFAFAAWSTHRRHLTGSALLIFFILLAPSSSFVPIATQTIAEHRMYLPLALILGPCAAFVARVAGRTGLVGLCLLALPLGRLTHARNEAYQTPRALWADTVARRPDNPRAHNNLGLALAADGEEAAALAHFAEAARLVPDNPDALSNLGNTLRQLGRAPEALAHYERALALAPDRRVIRLNLATTLHQLGRPAEAADAFAAAAATESLSADDAANHGAALLAANRPAEAIVVLSAAADTSRANARTHFNLGNAHAALAHWPEAVAAFTRAVALQPDYLPAQANLAQSLLVSGRAREAVAAYEQALRLRPGDPRLAAGLARARAAAGR